MVDQEKKDPDPQKLIDAVVASVMKSAGKNDTLYGWSPGIILGRPRFYVDTGSYALNWAISGLPLSGGYPGGRVVELFGDPSTGKSLLIYYALGWVTQHGGYGILDDTESCYMDVYGASLGIDNSRLIYLNSTTIEEHFTAIRRLRAEIRKKLGPEPPILMALDSLAQLSSEHEMETEFTKSDMTKAKQIKKGMRLLRPEMVEDEHTLYIVANHTIANIGDTYHPTTTPGGGGVKFQSSTRVELQLRGKLKEKVGGKDRTVGVDSQAKVVKNKIIAPFRECRLQIRFDRGVDKEYDIFESAKAAGVLEMVSQNGWYNFVGAVKGERGFQQKTFYESRLQEALELMEAKSTPSEKTSVTT